MCKSLNKTFENAATKWSATARWQTTNGEFLKTATMSNTNIQ